VLSGKRTGVHAKRLRGGRSTVRSYMLIEKKVFERRITIFETYERRKLPEELIRESGPQVDFWGKKKNSPLEPPLGGAKSVGPYVSKSTQKGGDIVRVAWGKTNNINPAEIEEN